MTLGEILETEGLPRRLIVAFAAACAKDALSKVSKPDPRSVLAVEVATRYGDGEDFTETYLREVADAARPTSYAYTAACWAYLAAYHAAYAFASAAFYYEERHKPLLLELINKRLTKVEIALILGV